MSNNIYGLSSREIISKLSTAFPKFSKIQLSMVRNPEYGVSLSADALNVLRPPKISDTHECQLSLIMQERGLTKAKLSKMCGVDKATLTRMEKGLGTRVGTALKVCDTLNISINELYN